MRIFWLLGGIALVVFLTLGRRRIDYRVVLLGAVAPDLIDLALMNVTGERRGFGHTFLVAVGLLLVIQLVLRGAAARTWFVLPIAMLIHLVLEGAWSQPQTLFWPLFGSEFAATAEPSWLDVITAPGKHSLRAAGEAAGLGVLLYMGFAYGLHRPGRLRAFAKTGTLAE